MPNEQLYHLGVLEILQGIAAGRFHATDVVRSCLDRIKARDDEIKAWVSVGEEQSLKSAELPSGKMGPLFGVPFGVKDVIDTRDLPTQMGSRLYEGWQSRYDAGVVAQLRMAGAVPLGKTMTCEFAGTAPTPTSNPLDRAYTPGGSSSGSAAAVADFMVPFALGTQTGGSVLRPAAFCGVVGFKPTYGFYTIAGTKPAAHSFDTIGLIARSVSDISLIHSVLMNVRMPSPATLAPRLGLFRSHLDKTVSRDVDLAFSVAVRALESAGANVIDVAAPAGFDTITEQRAVINAFERSRSMAGEWIRHRELMAEKTRAIGIKGSVVDGDHYVAARHAVEDFRDVTDRLFEQVDALVTPTTPGPAPRGTDDTGDPRLQELWTMLHNPSLTVPLPREAGSLPLGLQLVGRRFADVGLLAAALWVEGQLRGS